MGGPVLRLFQFRPIESGAQFDVTVRDVIVPRILATGGARCCYVGRHGDEPPERVIVSVWESAAALSGALRSSDDERFDFELAAELEPGRLETLPIALRYEAEDGRVPSILRVYRGRTRPGELEAYVEDARAGTRTDVEAGHGPVALYLGIDQPARFVTISAWADWAEVEAATGGDVRNPTHTRHSNRLAAGTAEHYEIVPNAARRAPTVSPV